MRTDRKTLLSSLLSEKMSFTVPSGWDGLSQRQLRKVIAIYAAYDERDNGRNMILTAALFYFMGVRVDGEQEEGILCRRTSTGECFLLDPELLPWMTRQLEWMLHPEQMRCRVGTLHNCRAVPFDLVDLVFGKYLVCENLYQTWMVTREWSVLDGMINMLYQVPDGRKMKYSRTDYYSVVMWWDGLKGLYAQMFPHLFSGTGSGDDVDRDTLRMYMDTQIRMLTKGDVTKEGTIMNNTMTLRALTELDAQAREAEDIRRMMEKNK